jgi:hypothetical protein
MSAKEAAWLSAKRQSPSRQMPVDRLDAEGQHQSPAAGRALEAPDALSKLLGTGTGDGRIHVLGNGSEESMFHICSRNAKRVKSESDGGRMTGRLDL